MRPCKFGMNCNKFRQGNCTFLHDNGGNQPNRNQNPRQQGGGFNSNPNYQSGGNQTGQYIPQNYNQNGGFGSGGRGGRGDGGRGGRGGPSYSQGPTLNQNKPKDFTQQFCRFFQTGQCNKGPKCNRKHGFDQNQIIKRSMKMTDIPRDPNCRLGSFSNGGNNYYSLREGNSICFFQYDPNSNQISLLDANWSLPQAIQTHYFNTKDGYIYFGYENPNTKLTSIGLYQILSGKTFTTQNAHKGKVTGMTSAIINGDKTILTSSKDGTIKTWNIVQNALVFNQGFTDGLKACYQTTGQNCQVLFVNTEQISGQQVIVAGTSDGRVLFWIGNQLNYQQCVVPPAYSKLLMIRFFCDNGAWFGVAIGWSSDHKRCAVIGITLQDMSAQIVVENQVHNPKQLLGALEISGKMLFLNNLNGLIRIYNLPIFTEVGCMMFNNLAIDMVLTKTQTQTGISLINFFVLEKLQQKSQGSLQIFLITE